MKKKYEDAPLLAEPLIKWIKTFKYDVKGSDFTNLSQLIGSSFLDNVIGLIRNSKRTTSSDASDDNSLFTVAERLHHLRDLLRQITSYYQTVLKQVILLPVPNLVQISESITFDQCEDDLRLFLLLILGCATQCSQKDKFISRITELLDKSDQEAIQDYFDQLGNNSMTAELAALDLDENMLHMYGQVTKLTKERGVYSEKYYDCFEKHSISTINGDGGVDNIPILIKPVVPVDHGGQWTLLSSRNKMPGADRKEEDVLVIRYRPRVERPGTTDEYKITPENISKLNQAADDKSEKVDELEKKIADLENKLANANNKAKDVERYEDEMNALKDKLQKSDNKLKENQQTQKELSELKDKLKQCDDKVKENDKLQRDLNNLANELRQANEKMKATEDLEKDNYNLKQQLNDLEFHKKKAKDLHAENFQLISDKQKLQDQLASSRRKEEDVIERLVDCQMKLDDALAEREMDRQKIAELMQNKNSGNPNTLDEISESEQDSLADPRGNVKKKIQELEREVETLRTRLMEAQKQDNQSEDKWKFLDLQKEKVDARRQLNEALEENEKLTRELEKLESKLKASEKELNDLQSAADISQAATNDQVTQMEDRIKDLTRQIAVLRKKGGKLSDEQFREMEGQEIELMHETIQELTTEVSKLKAHNKILRQTCDKLKEDVANVVSIEQENERLKDENRQLQKSNASNDLNSEQIEELRRQNLQLNIENKKLRRIIDTLRYTLMQVDPLNKHKYTYITSF